MFGITKFIKTRSYSANESERSAYPSFSADWLSCPTQPINTLDAWKRISEEDYTTKINKTCV